MDRYIFLSYEILASLIPFLIALVFCKKVYKREEQEWGKSRRIFLILFAMYIIAVFYFTGAGTLYDFIRNQFSLQWARTNLAPFDTGVFSVTNKLNILLFVPLGFFLPLLWAKYQNLAKVFQSAFFFSLLIELSQLLNSRSADVDDLIFNSLGGLVGYGIFTLLFRFSKNKGQGSPLTWEASLYIGILFLGRFFLFNDIGLTELMYGF